MSKRDAELWLLQCEPGTFLLRFSNTQIGGLSVAWVSNITDGRGGTKEAHAVSLAAVALTVADGRARGMGSSADSSAPASATAKRVWHLQPWFAKDFVIRSISDRYRRWPPPQAVATPWASPHVALRESL